MTLQEALATGKKFRRAGFDGYYTFSEHQEELGLEPEDIMATDWEVQPEPTSTLTEATLAQAWNNARAGSLAVKPAGESPFYKKLVQELFNQGE